MRRVHEPSDLGEGELLVAVLAGEGVRAHLLGGYLLGAQGELPVAGLLSIVVADEDAQRARELIAAYNAAQPLPTDWSDAEACAGFPGELLC